MDLNGYGGGGGGIRPSSGPRRPSAMDMYRRVPREMTEATKVGVIMSLLSLLAMVVLLFCETWAFWKVGMASDIEVDPNAENTLRLNFNVTLHDVECDFVEVDVWDTLGTNLQNVTKDILKWTLDDQGQRGKFHGRNKKQREIAHEKHEETLQDIADLNEGELHSADLTPENLQQFYHAHPLAIIDFFAPWCIWCQRLAPTWEKFAAEARRQRIHVGVGRVDCVEHAQLCKDERVMAFPTLRWYEKGKAAMPDYRGDRTVEALMDFARRRAASSKGAVRDDGADDEAGERFEEEHHPGCVVSGHLMVNRVPGNLRMEAKSKHHEINSAMTNLTHRVNHLSFGPLRGPQGHRLNPFRLFGSDELPENFRNTNPMKGRYYPTYEYHQAFHHHMKVVTTRVGFYPTASQGLDTMLYQVLEESQVVHYEEEEIPEVKFLWDMSPMSVSLTREGRRWYEYVTNLLAIVGGTYTTLGLINATLLRVFKPKKL